MNISGFGAFVGFYALHRLWLRKSIISIAPPPSEGFASIEAINIFHCAEEELFSSSGGIYYPPTYKQNGFVHLTGNPSNLLQVLNNFYISSKKDWICLEIDPKPYGDKLVYEAPAPVGNIASNLDPAAKFPRIYQGLLKSSVVKRYNIVRDMETGRFISITDLC